MREIKFMAWHKEKKILREVLEISFSGGYVILAGFGSFGEIEAPIRDIELMQYTGLKDKNGKEIYDGYIVKGNFIKDNSEVIGKVAYFDKDAAFICHLLGGDYAILVSLEHLEVIGNIYKPQSFYNE